MASAPGTEVWSAGTSTQAIKAVSEAIEVAFPYIMPSNVVGQSPVQTRYAMCWTTSGADVAFETLSGHVREGTEFYSLMQ
eukprot:3547937-Rhodomonas_salina.1